VASALDKGGAERVTRLYRHLVPTKNKRPVPILASRTKFSLLDTPGQVCRTEWLSIPNRLRSSDC
jgi:hypothetical protein